MKKHGIVAAAIISSALLAAMAEFSAYADEKAPIQLLTGATFQMEWSDDANRNLAE